MWSNFITHIRRGSICIPYILRDENLQTLGRFFAHIDTFKPYKLAQDIAKLKQQLETTNITEYLCKIWCTLVQWFLATMHFCNSLEVTKLLKSRHFAQYHWPSSLELYQIFICVTQNSTKCSELRSTFFKLGVL